MTGHEPGPMGATQGPDQEKGTRSGTGVLSGRQELLPIGTHEDGTDNPRTFRDFGDPAGDKTCPIGIPPKPGRTMGDQTATSILTIS